MKKGMKLIALAALVCAVLSCELGAPSGVKKRGGVDHTNEDVAPEDKAVFTGSVFLYYPTYDENHLKHAKEAVTEGKAVYKDGTYISTEYEGKDGSFIFRKDKTYSYKITFIALKTNYRELWEEKGTYTISEGQLVCTHQDKTKTIKTLYTISYNGDKLVLEQPGHSGMKIQHILTRSSGSLNVFGK